MQEQCLAIIPARGGSKRIPKKNIKDFLGVPIIKYSIDAALQSALFDEVMVSTEDDKIAKVTIGLGAKCPFYRSKKAANDHAMLAEVIEEVLMEYKKVNKSFDYVCCIIATAPFISSELLVKTYNQIKSTGADSLIPVTRFSYPIQRALKIENGKLQMICPENLEKRSQDLMPAYHDVGQFYWLTVDNFLKTKNLFNDNTIPYEVSDMEMQDIDTIDDWMVAEIKYKILKSNELKNA